MSRQPRLAEYAHELHRASAIAADVVGGRGGQHEIVMRPAGECRDVARAHIGPERKSRFATHLIDQPRALDRGVRSSGGASCARFFRLQERLARKLVDAVRRRILLTGRLNAAAGAVRLDQKSLAMPFTSQSP